MSDPRASTPSQAPRPDPPIDERIVMPESRAEILHGQLLWSAPADPPHAGAHCDLAYVLHAHVSSGYRAGVDLLTRTGHDSDFAPDASVYAKSAEAEPRRLEELAFEVTSEQALAVPTKKARELVRRGVRRVFAILVKQRRVMEWDRTTDGWSPMPGDAEIEDVCLVRPIRISALLDAASQDDEVARALLAKGNRVLDAAVEDGERRGRLRAMREMLSALGVTVDAARDAMLAAMSEEELSTLSGYVLRERRWPAD